MSNIPALLSPSADKMDLDKLLRDIPKYQPWIPVSAFEEWKSFAENASSTFTELNEHVLWIPPILKVAAEDRSETSGDKTVSAGQLSDTTMAFLQKERRVPKEVRLYLLLCNLSCKRHNILTVRNRPEYYARIISKFFRILI